MDEKRVAELKKEAELQGEGGTMTILGGEILWLFAELEKAKSDAELFERLAGYPGG